jgi:hypothetical protein
VGFFTFAVQLVVSLVLSYALRPDPPPPPPAADLEDLDVPTAEQGRPVPVLFGRREIAAPNTLWYGDLKAKPIKRSGGKK